MALIFAQQEAVSNHPLVYLLRTRHVCPWCLFPRLFHHPLHRSPSSGAGGQGTADLPECELPGEGCSWDLGSLPRLSGCDEARVGTSHALQLPVAGGRDGSGRLLPYGRGKLDQRREVGKRSGPSGPGWSRIAAGARAAHSRALRPQAGNHHPGTLRRLIVLVKTSFHSSG